MPVETYGKRNCGGGFSQKRKPGGFSGGKCKEACYVTPDLVDCVSVLQQSKCDVAAVDFGYKNLEAR